VDRALYVGMSGAMQTLLAQTANSNNLANASTTGFRAQLVDAQSVAVGGAGLPSRVNAQLLDQGWDASPGAVTQTGRDLDVSLKDGDWLAVQASDGNEAYTRAGNLSVDANGQLLTGSGQPGAAIFQHQDRRRRYHFHRAGGAESEYRGDRGPAESGASRPQSTGTRRGWIDASDFRRDPR